MPFGQVSERRQVAHAVEVDDPVQMIGLVLDDPREEILGEDLDAARLAVVAFEPDGGVPRHTPAHVGDR